uniref:Uncharacterized protein n=1 Tax=Anguilla anguilla TaxID=7936 RepID=A0A0E9UIS9_ANGAN
MRIQSVAAICLQNSVIDWYGLDIPMCFSAIY